SMRTRAIRASSNTMPKKDKLPSPGEAGTKLLNSNLPSAPKYSMSVLAWRLPFFPPGPLPSGRSTSVKTAPKPLTVAGWRPLVPGMKNTPSVMLLPTGVNNRDGLKVLKILAYVGLPNSTAKPPWGPPDGGACERPNPGVVNWLPRVFRNTLNGVTGAVVSRTFGLPPSQLISRRPLVSGPGLLPLLGFPSAARNASTEL